MIDLHTHSDVSDGSDPPERIPELAAEAGCSAVSLTDHDSLAGSGRARVRAVELGLTFVPGCEVSCRPVGPGGMHVLVYFVDDEDSPLGRELVRLRADRRRRNRALADRLVALGVPITYEMVVAEARHEESVGRPHFAAAMVAVGAAESIDDAFATTLANDRPGFVPKARLSGADVADLARVFGRGGRPGPSVQHGHSRARTWPARWKNWLWPASPASRPSTVATPPTAPTADQSGPPFRSGGHRWLGLPRCPQARPAGGHRPRRPPGGQPGAGPARGTAPDDAERPAWARLARLGERSGGWPGDRRRA